MKNHASKLLHFPRHDSAHGERRAVKKAIPSSPACTPPTIKGRVKAKNADFLLLPLLRREQLEDYSFESGAQARKLE